jgi:hypothetical protein
MKISKQIIFTIVIVIIISLFTSVLSLSSNDINFDEVKKVIQLYKNASIVFDEERENILLGFWNFGFPVSSGKYGYVFLGTGEFIYFNASAEGENVYYGTYGKWKEKDYRLYLLPIKDFLYKNDESYYAIQSQYQDWQLVSDLRSYDCYWYPSDKDNDNYPSSISIKIFRYFKMGSHKEFEKLIQSFGEMKVK